LLVKQLSQVLVLTADIVSNSSVTS
jgi:hypothetical protein